MQKITVLGGGSWGTAIAKMLTEKGYDTILWMRNKENAKEIIDTRLNKKYLPNILLPKELKVSTDKNKSIRDRDLLIFAIPTQNIRSFLQEIKDDIAENQIVCNVAKGLEASTHKRISQIFKEELENVRFGTLSGPSHAEEVSKKMPTTVVAASEDSYVAEYIQEVCMCEYFRVYANLDLLGVEIGGALKNVIALGAGIADGLGYGDNAKAAIINRGIVEIARLGEVLGAKYSTFAGLSGIGDLIVTCASKHSRNRKAGYLIGTGLCREDAIKEVGMVVEGIQTAVAANGLAIDSNIEMPICQEIYKVLFDNINAKNAVDNLMMRDKKYEVEI